MICVLRWNPGEGGGCQRGRSGQDQERHCHGECQRSLSGKPSTVSLLDLLGDQTSVPFWVLLNLKSKLRKIADL